MCLINLLSNFSFKKSLTILVRCVVIHNTIDFGKKLFFQVFFICFRNDFQTFMVHKKRLLSTFPRYTSRNHYLFRLPVGVMEKAIILNIVFIFKSIKATGNVWCIMHQNIIRYIPLDIQTYRDI